MRVIWPNVAKATLFCCVALYCEVVIIAETVAAITEQPPDGFVWAAFLACMGTDIGRKAAAVWPALGRRN